MNDIQIVYSSKASGEICDAQIVDIHAVAIANNARRDITGMLLYSKGTFLQVLEGEAGAIDDLMEKSKLDPRHCDVELFIRNSIKFREFKNWSMGYRRLDEADAKALLNYAPFFENGFAANRFCQQPGVSLEILKALASQLDDD